MIESPSLELWSYCLLWFSLHDPLLQLTPQNSSSLSHRVKIWSPSSAPQMPITLFAQTNKITNIITTRREGFLSLCWAWCWLLLQGFLRPKTSLLFSRNIWSNEEASPVLTDCASSNPVLWKIHSVAQPRVVKLGAGRIDLREGQPTISVFPLTFRMDKSWLCVSTCLPDWVGKLFIVGFPPEHLKHWTMFLLLYH